jgi:hypothetical protein
MIMKTCVNFEQVLDNIDNPLKIVLYGYRCASWSQSLIWKLILIDIINPEKVNCFIPNIFLE